jgi:hypothetical protein
MTKDQCREIAKTLPKGYYYSGKWDNLYHFTMEIERTRENPSFQGYRMTSCKEEHLLDDAMGLKHLIKTGYTL